MEQDGDLITGYHGDMCTNTVVLINIHSFKSDN